MSAAPPPEGAEEQLAPLPVCEFCGCPIEDVERSCPALDKGRCRP